MKKILSIMLVIALTLTFGIFALGSSDSEESVTNQGSESADISNVDEETNALGDYCIDIKSSRLAKDYEGKDVIIITYGFTNVSNESAASFSATFDHTVYQNGVGLNEAYILDDSASYTADNQLKEIKQGASIDVEVAYTLNDITTEVVVEISEYFSFDNKVLTKTFSIA